MKNTIQLPQTQNCIVHYAQGGVKYQRRMQTPPTILALLGALSDRKVNASEIRFVQPVIAQRRD